MAITIQTTEVESEVEKHKDVASERRFVCELPPEIQRLIASFLSNEDSILFCRRISKSLTSTLVSPPISPRMMTTQPRPHPKHPQIPYMVSLHEDDVFIFHHPLQSGFYRAQIPELFDARIRFSDHGWLLMSTCDRDVFFFEPFSKVKIELPKYHKWDRFSSMCFNLPPTSPDCFVIAVDTQCRHYNIIKRGQESWTKRSINKRQYPWELDQDELYLSPGSAPLMLNGFCYCLGCHGFLGVFDPTSDKPCWNFCFKQLDDSIRRCFLVRKNERELLRVLEVGEDRKIEMSSFNIKRRSWKREQSLGNKTLFLASGTCLLESTHLRAMYNKMYLPMLHNHLHMFYSLNHKKYRSFYTDYSSNNCFGDVKDFYNSSVWIKPVSPPSHTISRYW